MPDDSIPFVPTKVEVQILVREPVIKQEEIDRVKEELRNYTERVNSGKQQFSTLALMYSEDMLTAARGGECGLTYRAEFVPEFANVAFNLTDTKTVSKIVETEYGFHIIQLIEKVGDRVNVRHILKKPRVSDEDINKCVHFLDSVSDELRRGLYKFEECAPFLSHDKDTRNNYGLMYDANSSSSKFEMKDLPAEVAKVVSGLKIGEISAPFTMMNKKGKQVVAVVKLKNRTDGHTATMTEDYQLLQSVVQEKLSMERIEDWIREKQKTTYVRINEGWQGCEFKYPGWIK
jgi:peptidyl-prolyl cis-trans isomerase SurA